MSTEDVKLLIEIGMFLIAVGGIFVGAVKISASLGSAMTKFELMSSQNQKEFTEIKEAVEQIKNVLTIVAVQKADLQSLRQQLDASIRRTDETFKRIFDRLDGTKSS